MREEPASPSRPLSISESIETVNQVIAKLKETLVDMEDVLEALEVLERQGDGDEREIQRLHRLVQDMQRPRGGGGGGGRGRESERDRDRGRDREPVSRPEAPPPAPEEDFPED